jgi:hypothetical protein
VAQSEPQGLLREMAHQRWVQGFGASGEGPSGLALRPLPPGNPLPQVAPGPRVPCQRGVPCLRARRWAGRGLEALGIGPQGGHDRLRGASSGRAGPETGPEGFLVLPPLLPLVLVII